MLRKMSVHEMLNEYKKWNEFCDPLSLELLIMLLVYFFTFFTFYCY